VRYMYTARSMRRLQRRNMQPLLEMLLHVPLHVDERQ
jgi:hypothetical protein